MIIITYYYYGIPRLNIGVILFFRRVCSTFNNKTAVFITNHSEFEFDDTKRQILQGGGKQSLLSQTTTKQQALIMMETSGFINNHGHSNWNTYKYSKSLQSDFK